MGLSRRKTVAAIGSVALSAVWFRSSDHTVPPGDAALVAGWDAAEEVHGHEEIPAWFPRELTEVPPDYQDYITPDDPVVQRHAERTEIGPPSHPLKDQASLHLPFEPRYVTDPDQFDEDDRWVKPRTYLQDPQGDCEDYALAMTSIFNAMGLDAWMEGGYIRRDAGDEPGGHWVSRVLYKHEELPDGRDEYIADVELQEIVRPSAWGGTVCAGLGAADKVRQHYALPDRAGPALVRLHVTPSFNSLSFNP